MLSSWQLKRQLKREKAMVDKKRGLGRGLSALIGDVDIGLSADVKAPAKGRPNKLA